MKTQKENCTQHVNYCTRERLEVLRQCNSIAPIQIMHSMVNGNRVCWCRAHGLQLPPAESCLLGLGQIYKGLRINRGLTVDIAEGKRSQSSASYSDFISVLKGRSLCHFFMCFSKVL